MRRLVATIALLVLVPGIALAATSEAWQTHRAATTRLSVDAPSTWIDVTRLSPQVLAHAQKVPALRQYVELAKTSKVVKLIVADVGARTVASHFATSLNVVQAPTIGDLRLQRDATLAQLRSSGLLTSPVRSTAVTLPAGRAVELRYRARYGAGNPEVAQLQYLFVAGGKGTVLTYTTLPRLEAAYGPVFLRSARSLRFA
jgi:hypothetical protein